MTLEKVADGLWCLSSHFVAWGCKGSLRMTAVATSSGLLLYSPVQLRPEDIDAIERIDRVGTIVAPNLYHHFFLRAAMAAFPAARVLVPDGLEQKIGRLSGAEIMTAERPIAGPAEIEHFVFSGHSLRETILFHKPSRTLITADLLYNYGSEHFPAEKLFFRAIGCYGAPKLAFYHRFAIADRKSVQSLIQVVRDWRVRRVIMCHGRILEDANAGDALIKAWKPLA